MAQAVQARASAQAPSRRALFLRAAFFDFLLALLVSTALVFTVSYGFESAADLRGNVLLEAGVCAAMLAVLYAGGWSKRAMVFSAATYLAASVVLMAVFSALMPSGTELFSNGAVNDVSDNYVVFAFILAAVPLVVYLLSRRTWGVAVLLLLGALACGTVQFLYREWMTDQPGIAAAMAVYVGIGALFVVQGYRQGVLKARRVKETAFLQAFLFGIAMSVLCVLAATGLFAGVISGLGFGTVNIKPFEDYYSKPIVYYEGVYDEQQIEDPDKPTNQTNDETKETDENTDASEEQESDNSSGDSDSPSAVQSIMNVLDQNDWNQQFEAISYQIPLSAKILLALVPPALIALAVWLRLRVRKRRLQKLADKPLSERTVALFDFFVDRFEKLGIERPESQTPMEFAIASNLRLAPYARNASNTNFLDLTLAYQRAVYGEGDVGEEQYARAVDYYRAFFKNAHRQTGTAKWILWRFWRI